MKRKSKELKRIARDFLNNRYHIPTSVFITAALIPAAIEIPFSLCMGNYPTNGQKYITLAAEYLIILISYVLKTGTVAVHLNLTRGKPFHLTQVFEPFRAGADRYFCAALLLSFLGALTCLPLILGSVYLYFTDITAASLTTFAAGIILSCVLILMLILNYHFVPYLLLDHPQMRVAEAFKYCKTLLRGQKLRLFYILCSFLGYLFLTLLSFGFAAFWVSPYMTETLILFYLDCTGELNHLPKRDYSGEHQAA